MTTTYWHGGVRPADGVLVPMAAEDEVRALRIGDSE